MQVRQEFSIVAKGPEEPILTSVLQCWYLFVQTQAFSPLTPSCHPPEWDFKEKSEKRQRMHFILKTTTANASTLEINQRSIQ